MKPSVASKLNSTNLSPVLPQCIFAGQYLYVNSDESCPANPKPTAQMPNCKAKKQQQLQFD